MDAPGNISWAITATALVLLMTPGVAFFYGGLVKAKSVISRNNSPDLGFSQSLNPYRGCTHAEWDRADGERS